MNVSVFGLGYVGCVTAACMAKTGNTVVGVELQPEKVAIVNSGAAPFMEPGLSDLIAEQALKFVRDNKNRPFFCFVPTTVPHLALQVPDDSLQEYIGKFDDPPYPGGKGYIPHFRPRAAYAAMITRMDREVGRMMDLVKELKLDPALVAEANAALGVSGKS